MSSRIHDRGAHRRLYSGGPLNAGQGSSSARTRVRTCYTRTVCRSSSAGWKLTAIKIVCASNDLKFADYYLVWKAFPAHDAIMLLNLAGVITRRILRTMTTNQHVHLKVSCVLERRAAHLTTKCTKTITQYKSMKGRSVWIRRTCLNENVFSDASSWVSGWETVRCIYRIVFSYSCLTARSCWPASCSSHRGLLLPQYSQSLNWCVLEI